MAGAYAEVGQRGKDSVREQKVVPKVLHWNHRARKIEMRLPPSYVVSLRRDLSGFCVGRFDSTHCDVKRSILACFVINSRVSRSALITLSCYELDSGEIINSEEMMIS